MPDRVVVFDTSCLLCSKFIRILLRNDDGTLRFTGFESDFSHKYLPAELHKDPETVVFCQEGKFLLKSEAVLAILQFVGWRYRWLRVFRCLPKILLDKVYDWVARNRYSWFGQSATCFLPSAIDARRFLD